MEKKTERSASSPYPTPAKIWSVCRTEDSIYQRGVEGNGKDELRVSFISAQDPKHSFYKSIR